MKVHTVGHKSHSSFLYAMGFTEVTLDIADTVMFTGGEDVSPKYYRQPVGKFTYNNTFRDDAEFKIFQYAVSKKKNIVGICRGFQAIHAFQGLPLIQHMDNHNSSTHAIIGVSEEFNFFAPGDHHQNPLPSDKMIVIAKSDIISNVMLDGDNNSIESTDRRSIEIGFYPSINALGFQYHPEWSSEDSVCFSETQRIFKKYVLQQA